MNNSITIRANGNSYFFACARFFAGFDFCIQKS